MTSENKKNPSCSIYSFFFKNKMFVRFNHIIDVWKVVHSTTPVIPILYAFFELLARFTNIHNHTPEVYEKGQFPDKPPFPMFEGGIGRSRQIRWANFPPVKFI
jgi:hypothetical protein